MINGIGVILLGILTAWIIWCPLLHWLWAQLPQSASWYGVAKIGVLVMVGCGGGITFPLLLILLGLGLCLGGKAHVTVKGR
jgi:hypothetical protein